MNDSFDKFDPLGLCLDTYMIQYLTNNSSVGFLLLRRSSSTTDGLVFPQSHRTFLWWSLWYLLLNALHLLWHVHAILVELATKCLDDVWHSPGINCLLLYQWSCVVISCRTDRELARAQILRVTMIRQRFFVSRERETAVHLILLVLATCSICALARAACFFTALGKQRIQEYD